MLCLLQAMAPVLNISMDQSSQNLCLASLPWSNILDCDDLSSCSPVDPYAQAVQDHSASVRLGGNGNHNTFQSQPASRFSWQSAAPGALSAPCLAAVESPDVGVRGSGFGNPGVECINDGSRGGAGAGGVLAGDEVAVPRHMGLPVGAR